MKSDASILRRLGALSARGFDRFTVPGHKGALHALDFTELGLCEEIFPASAVEDAQRETAALYGVQNLFYLTNGSSMGITAALRPFALQTVLYAAGVHCAFTRAATLWNLRAVPVTEEGAGYASAAAAAAAAPITLEQADRALKEHPEAKALFITSPDYLGRVADPAIADLCREKGVALLVDAAHGAHFAFAPALENLRFENRADACNMSAHKTLCAYTQGAYLATTAAFAAAARESLELLGTTSPNYLLLSSLQEAARTAAAQRGEYARLKAFSQKAHARLQCLENADYTRLCVCGKRYKGKALYAYCLEKGILCETAIGDLAVFVLTPQDDDEKLERLLSVLEKA